MEAFNAHDFPVSNRCTVQSWNTDHLDTERYQDSASTATDCLWYGDRHNITSHSPGPGWDDVRSITHDAHKDARSLPHHIALTEADSYDEYEPSLAASWASRQSRDDNHHWHQKPDVSTGKLINNAYRRDTGTRSNQRKYQPPASREPEIWGYLPDCACQHPKYAKEAHLREISSASPLSSSSTSSQRSRNIIRPAYHLTENPPQAGLDLSAADALRDHGIDLARLLSQTNHLHDMAKSQISQSVQYEELPGQSGSGLFHPGTQAGGHTNHRGAAESKDVAREKGNIDDSRLGPRIAKVVVIYIQD